MRDPMSRAAAEFLPVDPFAGGTLGWHAQPEQQQAAKSKGKKPDDDDDDEDDDEDLDDDDEDEDEDDDDLADMTPEELKAELKAVQGQLARSSSSNAKKRQALKKKEAELIEARKPKAAPKAKPKGDDDGDAPDLDAVREEGKAAAKAEAQTLIKKAEARGALKAAGVPASQVAQLVGLLKLDDIDVDDDGEVDEVSLDDAVTALKKAWPALFPKGTRRRPSTAGDKDRDGRETKPRKPMTTTEMQVAAALGKPIRK